MQFHNLTANDASCAFVCSVRSAVSGLWQRQFIYSSWKRVIRRALPISWAVEREGEEGGGGKNGIYTVLVN